MAEKDVIAQLAKLSKQQRKILKMICDGNDYQTIAETFSNSKSTIKTHVGTIYVKLGLDQMTRTLRHKAIFEIYCPALHETDSPEKVEEPVKPEPEPKPVPQNVQLMVTEDEKAITTYRRGEIITIKPLEDKPENLVNRRTRNPLNMIVVIIVLALAVFGAFTIFQSLTKRASQAEIIQSTQQQNNMVSPTQIAVVPTNAEIVPSITPSSQPISAPKSSTLFDDNFDAGISPTWEVVSGNPMIVNGMLTAEQDTWLLVGDPSWKNYSVELDAETEHTRYNQGFDVIAVRVVDMNNMYAYKWTVYDTGWNIVQNGQWNELPKSNIVIPGPIQMYNFRITAKNNIITLYIDGIQQFSFVDSKFNSGRIGLLVSKGTVVDNFKVKELPAE